MRSLIHPKCSRPGSGGSRPAHPDVPPSHVPRCGVHPTPFRPYHHVHRTSGDDVGTCSANWPGVSRSPSHQRQSRRFPICPAEASAGPASHDSTSDLSDPKAARFKAWFLEHSKTLPTQLTPVRLPSGMYGLVTDEPVRRGQVLVRVPRHLLLTLDTARESPACGELVAGAGLSEWQGLVLHLLCERALGGRSFWAPYFDILPQDMSHHPLLWGPDRLAWLAGSPLAALLAGRQAQVVEDWEALVIAGANDLRIAAEWREATGTDLVTHGSVAWAAATLLSRSFSLDLCEEEPMEGDMGYFGTWTAHGPNVLALVPWADLLQHCSSAGPESCAAYQFELTAVTLSAHRDYRPGETAQDSHGQHLSPADMFLDYGVEDSGGDGEGDGDGEGGMGEDLAAEAWPGSQAEGGGGAMEGLEGEGEEGEDGGWLPDGGTRRASRHRYDADPADVAAPRSARNAALLRALAAVQGEGCRLALGEGGPDGASLTFLRAALAADVELVKAGWRVKATDRDVELACRVMGSLAQPVSTATETAVLRALAGFVDRALAAFPSSLQEDGELLEGRGGRPQVAGPERLAVTAVASQKRALLGTKRVVVGWLDKLEAGCDVAELYDEYDM